jgi:hypothetical protein
MPQAGGDHVQPSVDAAGSLEEKGYRGALPDVILDAGPIKLQAEGQGEAKNSAEISMNLNLIRVKKGANHEEASLE